ncbi:MAG: pullulanase-type alpha-1,6-glucosidase, partial [Pseudomonadota bacterium]
RLPSSLPYLFTSLKVAIAAALVGTIVGELPALPMDDVTVPGLDEVILHYIRPDGIYDGWGLHLWDPSGQDWTNFNNGEYFPEDIDPDFGAVYRIALPQNTFPAYSASPAPEASFPEPLGLIIHRGPEKDPGPDQFINISSVGNMIFVQSGINQIFSAPPDPNAIQVVGAGAHWLTADTLVWNPLGSPAQVALLVSDSASISVSGSSLSGEDAMYVMTPGTNPNLINAQHLSGQPAWTLPADVVNNAAALARGQLIAVALDDQGNQIEATEVQIPFLLDDLYADAAADADLGATFTGNVPTLSVWAPTARSVTANIYDAADDASPSSDVPLTFNATTGVWSVTGDASWNRKYYTYTVNVYTPAAGGIIDNVTTDPYSLNVSLGSSPNRLAKTQIVNMDDADLKPAGWDTLVKPPLAAPEDIVVYELQVRDFSANDDTVPAAERGKYAAFSRAGTAGRNHLEALADAGLTHVHLLPTFDIATVNEERSERVELDDPVEALCAAVPDAQSVCDDFPGQTIEAALEAQPADGNLQQQIIEWMRDLDGFNWGYDPYHFTVPEGSYASNPDGVARILEFRQMVKSLADEDLRLVMDVVYNHTNASGFLAQTSVFDKIVPGYYHRLGQTSGIVLGDSCCQDTASEHAMMDKFMVDSVVTWARDYKVDGFRYDLMGFHPKSTMEKSRDALQALTPGADGVDGSTIYLYGEGWNFGDIANDRRFVQATQANMAGTGIGTFNDRLRDGVRGGGPFDSGIGHRQSQGFASGLFYDPNSFNSGSALELNTLLARTDWARIGMTGNLANY